MMSRGKDLGLGRRRPVLDPHREDLDPVGVLERERLLEHAPLRGGEVPAGVVPALARLEVGQLLLHDVGRDGVVLVLDLLPADLGRRQVVDADHLSAVVDKRPPELPGLRLASCSMREGYFGSERSMVLATSSAVVTPFVRRMRFLPAPACRIRARSPPRCS
jgi:hypothetical protein